MTEQKKIKVLEGIRQGKIGGGESYLLSLVENMDKSVFEPIVLSFTDGPMVERLRSVGITTHVIYTEKPFDLRVWGKVRKLIRNEQIDLVHAHGTRAASNMFWAARKMKKPLVYTCHAWSFHVDQNPFVKNLRIRSEEFLTSQTDVNICGAIANRETAKKLFRKFDAEIIYNSIDPAKFNPHIKYKDLRAEMGFKSEDLIVVSVARFTLQKQPLQLIEAFSEVCKVNSEVKLLMVGDGELKTKSENLIKKLRMEDRIKLQPFRQDIPEVLSSADIFVLPSLWEAFPIALLEAMSMGKAVIATNVDGTPEIINHRQNGLMIDVTYLKQGLISSILELCNDPAFRKTLQANAVQAIYNKYNVDILARKNEAIYQRLIKK